MNNATYGTARASEYIVLMLSASLRVDGKILHTPYRLDYIGKNGHSKSSGIELSN
jgi:hypothetical protein